MIRSKGEAGTGDVSEAMKHIRTINAEIAQLTSLAEDELFVRAKELQAPYELVRQVAKDGRLPWCSSWPAVWPPRPTPP